MVDCVFLVSGGLSKSSVVSVILKLPDGTRTLGKSLFFIPADCKFNGRNGDLAALSLYKIPEPGLLHLIEGVDPS